MLEALKFKTFVWPHNPRSFTVEHSRKLISRKLPFGAYFIQDMGEDLCVFKGAGEFVGERAYSDFLRLAELFIEGGPGLLVHPLWPAAECYFAKLRLTQEPKENYLSYEFEFWQKSDGKKQGKVSLSLASEYYTVASGESIGDVVLNTGVSADEILALNPQLKNINQLSAGTKLRISPEV